MYRPPSVFHEDLDEIQEVPGGLMILKVYQGPMQFHGDKLAKDLKLWVRNEDKR